MDDEHSENPMLEIGVKVNIPISTLYENDDMIEEFCMEFLADLIEKIPLEVKTRNENAITIRLSVISILSQVFESYSISYRIESGVEILFEPANISNFQVDDDNENACTLFVHTEVPVLKVDRQFPQISPSAPLNPGPGSIVLQKDLFRIDNLVNASIIDSNASGEIISHKRRRATNLVKSPPSNRKSTVKIRSGVRMSNSQSLVEHNFPLFSPIKSVLAPQQPIKQDTEKPAVVNGMSLESSFLSHIFAMGTPRQNSPHEIHRRHDLLAIITHEENVEKKLKPMSNTGDKEYPFNHVIVWPETEQFSVGKKENYWTNPKNIFTIINDRSSINIQNETGSTLLYEATQGITKSNISKALKKTTTSIHSQSNHEVHKNKIPSITTKNSNSILPKIRQHQTTNLHAINHGNDDTLHKNASITSSYVHRQLTSLELQSNRKIENKSFTGASQTSSSLPIIATSPIRPVKRRQPHINGLQFSARIRNRNFGNNSQQRINLTQNPNFQNKCEHLHAPRPGDYVIPCED